MPFSVVLTAAPAPPPPSTTSKAPSSTATAVCKTSAPIIQNPGFETGSLSPWSASGSVGQSYYGVITPGSTKPGGGNYAFNADMALPNSPYGDGACIGSMSQSINLCPGTKYSVAVDYALGNSYSNTCTLGMSISGTTFASLSNIPRSWNTATTTYTASSGSNYISFSFLCHTPGNIELDNVNITVIG